MSYIIESVTLPRAPSRLRCRRPANSKDINLPGGLPMIIAIGNKARTLTIEGYIHEAGQTKSQLATNYMSPLEALVATQVTINFPDTIYDGEWIFDDFDFEEIRGATRIFRYRMKFKQGSDYVVL